MNGYQVFKISSVGKEIVKDGLLLTVARELAIDQNNKEPQNTFGYEPMYTLHNNT